MNETLLEMAAESRDPALWAALQLIKPLDPPPKTQGEAIDLIRDIFERAMLVHDSRRGWDRLRQAVMDLKTLCHTVARGDTREDRIHKALEANRIAASVDCMNGVMATQEPPMNRDTAPTT